MKACLDDLIMWKGWTKIDWLTKRILECAENRPPASPKNQWIESAKERLKTLNTILPLLRKLVYNRSK